MKEYYSVLVCGGRDYTDRVNVYNQLYELFKIHKERLLVISGMAIGADTYGSDWAKANGVPLEEFPALWGTEGRAAGPLRNIRMLNEGKPDLVLAFGGGTGTNHMVSISRKAGVEVREYDRHE